MSEYQSAVPMTDYGAHAAPVADYGAAQQQQVAPQQAAPGTYIQAAPGTYGAGYKSKDKYPTSMLSKEKKKLMLVLPHYFTLHQFLIVVLYLVQNPPNLCLDPLIFDEDLHSAGFSCAQCLTKPLNESTYVHLYEDRLEWNITRSWCSTIYDNHKVLYLDRDVVEAQTIPDCCRPACTHMSCCPTQYDMYGETVMLYGELDCCASSSRNWYGAVTCCFGRPFPLCNKQWTYIRFLKDAQALKFEIRKARQNLVAQGLARPTMTGATVTM
eukprot:UN01738